jgi:gold/copper resistance efflux system membrane fusion protein
MKPFLFLPLLVGLTAASPAAGQEPGRPVVVCQPVEREISAFDFAAQLEPLDRVAVRPPVTGALGKILVKPGAQVEAGQVLFELSVESLQKEVDRLAAIAKPLETKLADWDKKIEQAKKGQPKPVTAAELAKMEAERDLLAVRLRLAQADVKTAQGNLEQTKVKAPFAGKIDQVLVKEGDLVYASSKAATPLCTLVRTDPVRAAFTVDEKTWQTYKDRIQEGKIKADRLADIAVLLNLKGEKGFPHKGHLEFVDLRRDKKTGALRVQALVPNADGALTAQLLAPEDKKRPATIRVGIGEAQKVTLIPPTSVGRDDEGHAFVLVVTKEQTVERRRVKPGAVYRTEWLLEARANPESRPLTPRGLSADLQIIEAGLQPADWVVVSTEPIKRDPADKRLSPADFVTDLQLARIKPGTLVEPIRLKLLLTLDSTP